MHKQRLAVIIAAGLGNHCVFFAMVNRYIAIFCQHQCERTFILARNILSSYCAEQQERSHFLVITEKDLLNPKTLSLLLVVEPELS